ncbi:serine/threonine protein kinase [Dimargaris xerosporica]|nr:serine/threonine protein kinase [Dimargaris xerosporica]
MAALDVLSRAISPSSTLCEGEVTPVKGAHQGASSPRPLSQISQWFQQSRSSTKTRSNDTPTRTSSDLTPFPFELFRVVMRRPLGYIHSIYGPARRQLGAGTNGVVSLHHRIADNEQVAIKRLVIPKSALRSTDRAQRYVRHLLREASLTRSFDHPNIIATHDIIQETDGVFYTVMEHCPLDLFALVQQSQHLSFAEINCYFAQIVRGLYYLHVHQRVAHRDLKLDNVCVTPSGAVKIIDFGCVTSSNPKYDPHQRSPAIIASGACGSDTYMAPELFGQGYYDARKVDVWALAIVYIAMCTKHFPWDRATAEDTNFALFARHPEHILRRMLPKNPEVRPLLRGMLSLNPQQRPSIPTIMATRWFQSIDACPLSTSGSHSHHVPTC